MAGTGIRAVELARALAREHTVTLAAPGHPSALPPGVRGHGYTPGDAATLAGVLAAADLVVANGHVLAAHPELASLAVPLVLDMYDPTPLENLALFREDTAAHRQAVQRRDVGVLAQQLRAGDCFLCATERQRDMYLGALLALGRVDPQTVDADPTLRGLLRVVPFGVPDAPPMPQPAPWPDLGAGAQVILWTGGLWDWMDPLTLVDAMPAVVAQVPGARLVLLAGQHPGNTHPMQMPGRVRARAAELGLLGSAVVFVDDWVPYEARAGALLNADIAIYLHAESLESQYAAVRSRFLDHLWAGLPSVVTAGDAAAQLVTDAGLGATVPAQDAAAVAATLISLLHNNAERAACAERARELGRTLVWSQVAEPLLAFCRHPRRTAVRSAGSGQVLDEMAHVAERDARASIADGSRNTALDAVRAGWQIAEPPPAGGLVGRVRRLFIDHLVRPFVGPLLAQQNAQNAAVIRALDALAENSDVRRSDVYALLDAQEGRVQARINAVAAALASASQRIDETNGRLADLDAADTLLAERLADGRRPAADE